MIDQVKYAYAPTYDIYVNREPIYIEGDPTPYHLLYKRCNRQRKSEITEEELVPVKLYVTHNGYYKFWDSARNTNIGIQYAFADAFPDRVQGWEDHLADFTTYCELDHLHGHATYESNYAEHLRWTSVKVNRARTSKTIDLSQLDSAAREKVLKERERQRKRRQDPEKLKKQREQQAAYRRRKYAETKAQRSVETIWLNTQVAKVAAAAAGLAEQTK